MRDMSGGVFTPIKTVKKAKIYGESPMKNLVRIGIVGLALVAVAVFVGYKSFTGGLFSGVEAAVEIGEKVPNFTLKDAAGNEHSLEQYTKEGKIVVLEFCTQECPFSKGADKDLIALHKEYKDKGVIFLGIDSNKNLTPADIKKYQEESGKSYPILVDVDNKYADVIGAKVTPEMLVVDKEGNLKYHGAFDSRMSPDGDADQKYTKDAIDAVLEGKEVATETSKAWGCGIKRR
jgi:peroxiredoxin